jgi:hypothetical protein
MYVESSVNRSEVLCLFYFLGRSVIQIRERRHRDRSRNYSLDATGDYLSRTWTIVKVSSRAITEDIEYQETFQFSKISPPPSHPITSTNSSTNQISYKSPENIPLPSHHIRSLRDVILYAYTLYHHIIRYQPGGCKITCSFPKKPIHSSGFRSIIVNQFLSFNDLMT